MKNELTLTVRERVRFWLGFFLLAIGGPVSIVVPNTITGLSSLRQLLLAVNTTAIIFWLVSLSGGALGFYRFIIRTIHSVDSSHADRSWLLLRVAIILWGIIHNVGFSLLLHRRADFIYDPTGLVLVGLFSFAVGLFFSIILITGSGTGIERATAARLNSIDDDAPETHSDHRFRYSGLTSKLFLNVSLGILAFLIGAIGVSLYGVYAGTSIEEALIRTGIVAIPFLCLTVVLVMALADTFARPLERAVAPLEALQAKDLRQDFPEVGRDELGVVFSALRIFVATLRSSLAEASRITHTNLDRSAELDGRVAEQNKALAATQESLRDIEKHLAKLYGAVDSSAGASEEISKTIESLDQQITTQSEMVVDTLAAAEEMAESVENVTRISRQRRDAAQQLRQNAAGARTEMDEALNAMRQVTTEVDELKEVNQLVARVAAQTNLLAMNAAIEAAHAGDAGRGFSVVAEEIRALASTSSEHARKTSQFLKQMVNNISGANSAVEKLHSSFDEVDTETAGAAQSLEEIAAASAQMSAVARQIQEQMTRLSEVNHGITAGSTEMKQGIGEITTATQHSREVAGEVETYLQTINSNAMELEAAAVAIGSASETLRSDAQTLNDQLDEFKV